MLLASCDSGASGGRGDAGADGGAGAHGEHDASAPHSNRAPKADAGANFKAAVGDEITLDGSASTDADGDRLTYAWTVFAHPVDSAAQLSDPSAVRPKFKLDHAGTYTFELVVNDGKLSSEPDRVMVATVGNLAPMAEAGPDQAAHVGDRITLDGSGSSDPDGDEISYRWSFVTRPDGSHAELSDETAIAPEFTVDVDGDYEVELVVRDAELESDPDRVLVSTRNVAPVAVIADVGEVLVDRAVALDATGSSDANGDPLSYHWSLSRAPDGSSAIITDADAARAALTPDRRGDYVVQLIVNDGQLDSKPATLVVPPENRAPVADAGADRDASVGETVSLTGAGSQDPDHDPLTFSWTLAEQPQGSAAVLANASSATPSFVADVPGSYRARLVVNDGDASSAEDEVVIMAVAPPAGTPLITDFAPRSARFGTVVEVTGINFLTGTSPPRVLLHTATGTIEAPIAKSDDGLIAFSVPPGAVTGTFDVDIGSESVTSPAELTVLPSSSFGISAEPESVRVLQGASAAYVVKLASDSGFADLATLTATGLPSTLSASFSPAQIRAGDWALLTVSADGAQPAGDVSFALHARAEVDGAMHDVSTTVTAQVLQASTAFVGRAVRDDARQTPLAGVGVTLLPRDGNGQMKDCSGHTVTDAAGNFLFTDLAAGCTGAQMVEYDGLGVTSPAGDYAGVDLVYELAPGAVTTVPVLVHLPRIDDAETVMVAQNASSDQTFTFKSLPGVEVTVYAGTTLRMPDGSTPDPFPFTGVAVPIDRLPEEVPQNGPGFHYFVVAFQPANATASQPVAVSYPNLMRYDPGLQFPLLTLDPTQGVVVQYGTGTVSPDGTMIVPDADPAHSGHRYGLVHFDWHMVYANQQPPVNPSCGGNGTGAPQCVGKPVDLATGLAFYHHADIGFGGGRGGIGIVRQYRTLSNNAGPFGIGTGHNYRYELNSAAPSSAQSFNLVLPNGSQVPFARQSDGTFISLAEPSVRGAVFRHLGSNLMELRWKGGMLFRFAPYPVIGGSVLTSIVDPSGNVTTFTRSNASRPRQLTEIADPVGRQLSLQYDASDRITRIRDPLGRAVAYTYNAQGYLATFTNTLGGVSRYEYTADGKLLREIDERGVTIAENTFDSAGRVIAQRQADGGVLHFAYTVVNAAMPLSPVLETVLTDALGQSTHFRYGPQGFLLSVTDALGQTHLVDRENATNRITHTVTSGGSDDQRFSYDDDGNLLEHVDPLGATTTLTWNRGLAKPTSVTDGLGGSASFSYDAHGNLKQATDPLGRSASFEYDSHGQLTATVDPLGTRRTLQYDALGNLIAATDALGHVTRTRYDAVSRPIETLDAQGRRASIQYDDGDRVLAVTDPAGATTHFEYDAAGNVTAVVDALGHRTEFTFDDSGRTIARKDPLGRTEAYGYDLNGRLITHTDRRGLTAQLSYDALDRLMRAAYADSTVDYEYDAQGHVGRVSDTLDGEHTFRYDARGALLAAVGPSGSLSYTYDAIGQLATRAVAGGPTVSYQYDAAGQLLRAAMAGAGVGFAYDALGRVKSEQRDNGVDSTYGYDVESRLTSLVHQGPGGTIDAQAYAHDASGSTTRSASDLQEAFTTEAVTASYDAGNQIQSWGPTSYTHDEAGNRLTATKDGVTTHYVWDARGRLTKISGGSDGDISLYYDFAGNLDRIVNAKGEERQLVDGFSNVVLRRTTDGTTQHMLSGLGMDHQMALVDSQHGTRYPLLAMPNSTVATVDDDGAMDGQYSYEPYGAVQGGGEADYPFLFTGRTPVGGGFYYYRARYYDSVSSRFLSEDPARFESGEIDLFRYVGDAPIGAVDPTGLASFSFDAYFGFGFGLTVGIDNITGRPFASVRVGVGTGVDWGFDSMAGIPGCPAGGSLGGLAVTGFAQGSASLFRAGVAAKAEYGLRKDAYPDPVFGRRLVPSLVQHGFELTPTTSRSHLGGGVSAGVEVTRYW